MPDQAVDLSATLPTATKADQERANLLDSYERGDLTNKFIPISEEEAEQIVERIRRVVSGGE